VRNAFAGRERSDYVFLQRLLFGKYFHLDCAT
jgi:hypothetical protein